MSTEEDAQELKPQGLSPWRVSKAVLRNLVKELPTEARPWLPLQLTEQH